MAHQPTGTTYDMLFPRDEAVSFDVEAFDEAIHSQGVELVHMRAMRCPVGLIDPDDIRRPHEHHESCSNGFVYTLGGTFTGLFVGNSKQDMLIDPGLASGSTAQVAVPRFYDKCTVDEPDERIMPTNFDRIYLKEEAITVVHWQLFQIQPNRKDRLSFPAVKIVDIMDSDGKTYHCGSDFIIENGGLHWIGNWPGLDAKSNKGKIIAIRYLYRPFWYVKQMLHEVRVAQAENEFTGERQVFRMPQALLLQREYLFLKEERDEKIKDEIRQVQSPPDGVFGPR